MSVSKHQVDCVNDPNQVANSTEFSMHAVQVDDLSRQLVFIESVPVLVVNLLVIVPPFSEGCSKLTAGRLNSTIALVTGCVTWISILVERCVRSSLKVLDWKRCVFAPGVHIDGVAQVDNSGPRYPYELSLLRIEWNMLASRVRCNDEHIQVDFAIEWSEFVLLMCPKSIGQFHSGFPQMMEFIDGFQLVLVGREVIRLSPGLWSMDFVIVGWSSSRVRVILLERVVLLVVQGIRHIFIGGCSG